MLLLRMRRLFVLRITVILHLLSPPVFSQAKIVFEDLTEAYGLKAPLAGIMGHGAAWGDVDRDGAPDLFMGGFADRPASAYAPASGPVGSQLFKLDQTTKTFAPVPPLQFARTSGGVFADLDNDGWLDLYVANNSRRNTKHPPDSLRARAQLQGASLFHNRSGTLQEISFVCGACPPDLRTTRNVAVLDFDLDGLLDLLVIEDRFIRSPRSRLFRNHGDMRFKEITDPSRFPQDLFGLGCATADVNRDGRTDVFIGHSNRLLLGTPNGFRESKRLNDIFAWTPLDNEDWPCGAAFGDLNRDGLPDLVLGIHGDEARNRIYLHQGVRNGEPAFHNVTEACGWPDSLPVKSPHVEIQDFDNDGWPDIYLSVGWRDAEGKIEPVIFRHAGLKDGLPQFELPRNPSQNMVYFPAGPTVDVDRDGRVDLFLVNWFAGNHSRLKRNRSPSGNWLAVEFEGRKSNRMGIGTKLRATNQGELIFAGEMSIGYGYASGQEAVLHIGLGHRNQADLEVVFPSGIKLARKSVKANQRLRIVEPAGSESE